MNFFELTDISERYLELVNPTTPEKVLTAGRIAGMKKGCRVIDFGSGHAAALILWGKAFDISGFGIDIRPTVCERARQQIKTQGLDNQIEIVCANVKEYTFESQRYDIASSLGTAHIWKTDFREQVRAMRQAITPKGRLIIGRMRRISYTIPIPVEYTQKVPALSVIITEHELLHIAHEEGLELVYVLHSSQDEWDNYEAEHWRALLDWLDENPTHPERADVRQHLHDRQELFLDNPSQHFDWALYVLKPSS